MDFNDRLRTQLRTQSTELQLSTEGSNAVRSRSKRRKQRRAGGTVMATLLVVLLAGGWIVGRSGDTEANVATEGDADSADEATTESTIPESDPIDIALPEAGVPLVLSTADNVGAPGGYNVFQSGRSGGLYFVLSTAPGVTYDDIDEGGGTVRNDTMYTFDGSSWSQDSTGDRFISTVDSANAGLLYTVSTGTASGPALELGTSANAGQDWSWTELDLSSVFGADQSTWPPYAVQYATSGSETLVIVHTQGGIDWEEAVALAVANGADIDPDSNQVTSVDRSGISWTGGHLSESNRCLAALNDILNKAWENEPEGPELDLDRELTDAEQAEIEAYWTAQELRGQQIYAESLQSVARVPGCESFVKCTTEHSQRNVLFNESVEQIYADHGGEISDPAVLAQIDENFDSFIVEVSEWGRTSGCVDAAPNLFEGEVAAEVGDIDYASWESLGVLPPDSWKSTTTGFLVNQDAVAEIGDVFGAQDGFLAQVEATTDGWSVTFDSTVYTEEADYASTYTIWSSIDGDTWTSSTSDSFNFFQPARLSDGTTFAPDWAGESTNLLRRTPDGTTSGLTLTDLAAGLDTGGYQIMNVRAGDYGVVAWAVKWEDVDEGEQPYDSIVFYSPDGIGWGATAVSDVEIIDVIVGDEEVMFFLNDPNRTEDSAQPIMIGQA